MFQQELLWGLQDIDRNISLLKKEIKNKELLSRLSIIKEEYAGLKKDMEAELHKMNDENKKAVRLNIDLKHLDDKVKECSRRLYEDGSSMKIIDSLEKERDAYKKAVDETEDELLRIMEENGNLESSIEDKKARLSSLKREFEELKSRYVKISEKAKEEVDALNKKRDSVAAEIDEELLKQYSDIAARRNNPVSRVEKGMCTECGVMLNAMLYDKLKRKSSISLCEHCGRILYLG